jgi:hypothetical protein
MAYDAGRRRVVLFGGSLSLGPEALSDTWEYDGATWVKVALTGPPGRFGHGLTYDTQRGRIVLQGGATYIKYPPFGDLIATSLFDTWEYDGATWVERSPPPAGPPAASPVALVYDPARQRVRRLGLLTFPDLWEYDGTRWEEHEGWPSGMEGPALAYDEHRRRVIALYPDAEQVGLGALPPCRTFEHDGRRWHRVRTAFTPENRSGHALAYDAGRRRTVLFGGYYNLADTWEYDGVAWQRRSPTTSPSGRDSHAMAYDRARGQVVLFGGRTRVSGSDVLLSDTWTYNGTTWTQVTPAHAPTQRYRAAMAYDEVRGRLVLHGGAGTEYGPFYSDTWEWSGTDWIALSPAQAPPARAGAGLAFDASAQRMILFGGSKLNFTFGDTWLWDGTQWQEADPPWAPPRRTRAGLAYHGVLGAVVLLGGIPYDGSGMTSRDLWVYRPASTWPEEICDSNQDRDLDGVVGCADPDCDGQGCAPGQVCQSGACVGYCGNGACDAGETAVSCPRDCDPGVCGDHACTGAETAWSCPGDCGGTGYCGDGTCSSTESAWRCPGDCPVGCGDGLCNGDEDDVMCIADCVTCGNYACEMGESKTTCFEDCSLPQCPNFTCNTSEDHEVCPIDCPTVCGDGRCHREERGATCPADCGAFAGSCGDAVCAPGEDEWFCPADCAGQGYCGDATCDPTESRFTCAEDCPPFCGDTVCDPSESKTTCPVDCPAVCGDHDCDPGESSVTCPADCPPVCGDGICQTGESMTCPMDCAVCGNMICDPGETSMTCPMDCPSCGNMICDPGETSMTCPMDCP